MLDHRQRANRDKLILQKRVLMMKSFINDMTLLVDTIENTDDEIELLLESASKNILVAYRRMNAQKKK
ncbi:MAG: hypothetical protein J6M60_06970 [Clostridia bacterium]|nr:hypothetical protein [Clostridia bacterium]